MSDIAIRTSPEIGTIAEAIAKAQAELENIDKGGVNPAFRAKYVKLGDVLDEVRPKFAKHGIAIIQHAINGDGSNVGVATLFAHSSGQWIESRLYVAPTKFDAQGAGSAITYLRRYSLMAMAGVAPDDDDGNAAVAKPEARKAPAAQSRPRDAAPATPFDEPPPNGHDDAEREASRDDMRTLMAAFKAAPNEDAIDDPQIGLWAVSKAKVERIRTYGGASAMAMLNKAAQDRIDQLRGDKV
jgi:hypothetical protein